MKDLFAALSLFTNINLYKEGEADKRKFILCFFPFTGFIAGLFIVLWSALSNCFGIHRFIISAACAVILVCVGSRFIIEVSQEIGNIIPALIYYGLVWAFVFIEPIWGAAVLMGVFTLSRVMTIFLCMDNPYIKEGLFKSILENSQRFVSSVIIVVWLMASAAIIEMYNIYYFIMTFLTMLITLMVFSKRAKKKSSLEDKDIYFYTAYCEFIVIVEFIVFTAVKLVLGR